MNRYVLTAALFMAVLPLSATAQSRLPNPASVELNAEHEQWEIDHKNWAQDHIAFAKRLRALADKIESGDVGLAQHGGEIDLHGKALAKGKDTAKLAAAHVRLRGEHEETRIAHRALEAAIQQLELIVKEDNVTDAAEVTGSK